MQLIHGDCLEKMADIPDGSVDMILCDLPYGTTACKWDVVIPFEPLWYELDRLIYDIGSIVLFGIEPFSSQLRVSNLSKYKYDWVWKKSKGSNFPHAPNMPLKITENIMVFSNGIIGHHSQASNRRMLYNPQGIRKGTTTIKQNRNSSELMYHRESQTNHTTGYTCKAEGYPNTLLDFGAKGRSIHPTQKPVALLEYLIKTYTMEGHTVLDFTMGSGSTGIACINTKRNFIGIEKDDKYFEIAKKRIEEHLTTAST
jgi:site-specific DNA-methyltransferase (adenine-specific)